jgi:hypothetical protein
MRPTALFFASLLSASILGAASGTTSASPSSTPAEVQVFQVRDQYASARFRSQRVDPNDPSRTIYTDVIVVVNSQSGHAPGAGWVANPDNVVFIQDYYCTPGAPECTPLVSVNAVMTGTFQVDQDLGSASLSGTAVGVDYFTRQVLTISVALTWTAIGPSVRTAGGSHTGDSSSGLRFVFNQFGVSESRPAVATGTVAIGSFNYTPLPSRPPRDSLDLGNIGNSLGGVETITVTGTAGRQY